MQTPRGTDHLDGSAPTRRQLRTRSEWQRFWLVLDQASRLRARDQDRDQR